MALGDVELEGEARFVEFEIGEDVVGAGERGEVVAGQFGFEADFESRRIVMVGRDFGDRDLIGLGFKGCFHDIIIQTLVFRSPAYAGFTPPTLLQAKTPYRPHNPSNQ